MSCDVRLLRTDSCRSLWTLEVTVVSLQPIMRMILNFISQSRTSSVLVAFVLGAMFLSSCGGTTVDGDQPPQIVATTSILGDVVRSLTGDLAVVEVIIGDGVDPHDFSPSARQVESIAAADLVIGVGLGLEGAVLDVVDANAQRSLLVGPLVEPIPLTSVGSTAEPALDPHIWQDPVRMAAAAQLIVDELSSMTPDIDWAAEAGEYLTALESLDGEVERILAPVEQRLLVTSHDSLGYLANRFEFTIVGVVVAGGSTEAEPSAADLGALANAVRESEVAVIFTDAYNPTTLAEAVAGEVGYPVEIVPLVTDALTPQAPTYLELMRWNATRIAEALEAPT